MSVIYFMIFFSLSLFGQEKPNVQKITPTKSMEDFEHQFKGCLENSHCDEIMGLQLTEWKDFLKNIKEKNEFGSKKAEKIENFRVKKGIPVEFYTTDKSQIGFKPLLYDSPCKVHSVPGELKVQRGLSFVKSIDKEKAVIWRNETQIEVPLGDFFFPQIITVFFSDKQASFLTPIDEQPLFIRDSSLFFLKEDHENFYILKISPNGEWKIVDIEMSELLLMSERKKDSTCPNDLTKIQGKIFNSDICQSIWNEDEKKHVIIKMQRGCLI